jgi:hypothetical protein
MTSGKDSFVLKKQCQEDMASIVCPATLLYLGMMLTGAEAAYGDEEVSWGPSQGMREAKICVPEEQSLGYPLC